MDPLYLFACGVAWCRTGDPDAGLELLRGLESADPAASEVSETMLKRCAKASAELLEASLQCGLIHAGQAARCLAELHQIDPTHHTDVRGVELRRPA